jgi:hypothetical protein
MPQTCFLCQVSGHNRVTCTALQDAEKDIQKKLTELKAAQEKKARYERQWQKVKEKQKKHTATPGQKEVKPEQQHDDESDEGGEAGQQHDMKPHVTPNGQVSIVVVNRVSINQTI